MSGNQFLNFFLFGICELPANFLGLWLVELIGRRWTGVFAFLASIGCALGTVPLLGEKADLHFRYFLVSTVPNNVLLFYFCCMLSYAGHSTWVPTMLLTSSKMFITVSFLVIYIQGAEIYPTSHRSSGSGFSTIVTSTTVISAPYIAYLVSRFFAYLLLRCILASSFE